MDCYFLVGKTFIKIICSFVVSVRRMLMRVMFTTIQHIH